MGENSRALENYNKALEIQQKSLPSKHPDLATSYNKIGACIQTWEYSRALENYNKALGRSLRIIRTWQRDGRELESTRKLQRSSRNSTEVASFEASKLGDELQQHRFRVFKDGRELESTGKLRESFCDPAKIASFESSGLVEYSQQHRFRVFKDGRAFKSTGILGYGGWNWRWGLRYKAVALVKC